VVDRGVVRDAQDPRRERDRARLVALQRGHELREDLLRDVLGLVLVTDDRADVAVDVVGVAQVEQPHGVVVALLRAHDGGEDDGLGLLRVLEPATAEALAPTGGGQSVGLPA
jgi:hypothetical protein